MASKSKNNGRSVTARAEAQEQERLLGPWHEEQIRRRAYEIYLQRGEQPGNEIDDWLQAERELRGD